MLNEILEGNCSDPPGQVSGHEHALRDTTASMGFGVKHGTHTMVRK